MSRLNNKEPEQSTQQFIASFHLFFFVLNETIGKSFFFAPRHSFALKRAVE